MNDTINPMGKLGCLILILAMLVACSSHLDAPDQLPSGYSLATGDRVGLGLPSHYTAIQPSPADFQALADRMQEQNPFLAERIKAMAEEIRDDTLRLAAYHEDELTTLAVTSESVPAFRSAADQAAANRRGLSELGYTILETGTAKLNDKQAEWTNNS